jgi:hypothetical protein
MENSDLLCWSFFIVEITCAEDPANNPSLNEESPIILDLTLDSPTKIDELQVDLVTVDGSGDSSDSDLTQSIFEDVKVGPILHIEIMRNIN